MPGPHEASVTAATAVAAVPLSDSPVPPSDVATIDAVIVAAEASNASMQAIASGSVAAIAIAEPGTDAAAPVDSVATAVATVNAGEASTEARSDDTALTTTDAAESPAAVGPTAAEVSSPSEAEPLSATALGQSADALEGGAPIVNDTEAAQALAASAYETALQPPTSNSGPQDGDQGATQEQSTPAFDAAHAQAAGITQSSAEHVSADSVSTPVNAAQPSLEPLPSGASQAQAAPVHAAETTDVPSSAGPETPADAPQQAAHVPGTTDTAQSVTEPETEAARAGDAAVIALQSPDGVTAPSDVTQPSETAAPTSDASARTEAAASPSADTTPTAAEARPVDAPPEATEAAATAPTSSVPRGNKDEWATLTFTEVTTPFGLKLAPDEADLADEVAPESSEQAEPPSTDAQSAAPTPEAPAAPRKVRGFVVAEHGELLTTPVSPVAQDVTEPEAHGNLPAPAAETPEFTSPPVAPTPRAPIELDDLSGTSDEPMQLASTWEFVGWQGGNDSGPIGHVPESTWADRAVDLEGPVSAPASNAVPLASAWDFIQQPWQPTASEPSELITSLLAAAAGASTETPANAPSVTAEQVLSALDVVGTQGTLGRVVLAYCAGRFQRAFLLGESLGLARVGHAWGPGSDTAAVSGLKVDLEAPSLLHSATTSLGASVFDAPACPQDEAIFAALGGEGPSHLAVIAIRHRGQAVAFIVADHGAEPVGSSALDELNLIAQKASEAFDRLPTRGA